MKPTGKVAQRGMVLIVGLVLLVALTLIGITAIKMTSLDQRIAANAQYRAIAFQGAESMLQEAATAEQILQCINANFSADCVPGQTFSVGNSQNVEATATITDAGNVESGGHSIGQGGGGVTRLRVFTVEAESHLGNTRAHAVHRLQVGIIAPAAQ